MDKIGNETVLQKIVERREILRILMKNKKTAGTEIAN